MKRTPWLLSLAMITNVAAAEQTLSYAEALRTTLAANPQLQAAGLSLDQAEADLTSSKSKYDPTLRLDGGWNRSDSLTFLPPLPDAFENRSERWNVGANVGATTPIGTELNVSTRFAQSNSFFEGLDGADELLSFQPSYDISITQELLKGVLIGFNNEQVDLAKNSVSRARMEFDRIQQEQLAAAATAYWNWVYQVEVARIAEQSITVAEENLRIGKERVAIGQAAPVEETRLEAALIQARSDALNANHNAQTALDELLLLMGQLPGRAFEPSSAPGEVEDIEYDLQKAVDVAIAESYDVRLAEIDVDNAEIRYRNAKHGLLPSLQVSGNYGMASGSQVSWDDAFEFWSNFPAYGISGVFSVPLGNRAARGNLDKVAAELATATNNLEEARRRVSSEASKQVRLLLDAKQKVELADINVTLAEQTLASEEALYAAGRSILKTVLEARTDLDTKRAEAAKARTDYRTARVELLKLLGRLDVDQELR